MIITNAFGASKQMEYGPLSMGISGVNLKAAAATQYVGNKIDLSEFRRFHLTLLSTVVGAATVGSANVRVEFFDHQVPENALLASTVLWSVITPYTAVGTTKHCLAFGEARTGVADVGTVALTANLFMTCAFVRFALEVNVASDAATSCLGSLLLRMQT